MSKMKRRKKLNNVGFTLIEVLTAMAILGVVSLAIYTFMSQGSRLYRKTTSDATIQTEAQTVANTISDLVIDCEVNISYGEYSIDGYTYSDVLEIDNSDYQFLIINTDEKLFYVERSSVDETTGNYVAFSMDDAELLAENITAFSCDLSRISGNKRNILTFEMTYESGGRKYSGNYQVNLRNSVTVGEVVTAPYEETATLTKISVQADRYVEIKGRDTLYDSEIYPTPNLTSLSFTASSNASNVTTNKLYSWSIETGVYTGASINGDTDGSSLYLDVEDKLYTDSTSAKAVTGSSNTIPSSFTVTCTSLVETYPGSGVYASGSAVVYYKKILDMNVTPYTGITNDCIPENEGTTKNTAVFVVTFSDYNLDSTDKTVTWSLEYSSDGGSTYTTCPSSMGTISVSTNSTAVFTLGSSATTSSMFRIVATSDWDSTWDASFEFGVSEVESVAVTTNDAASRGVEIDITAWFQKMLAEEYYTSSGVVNYGSGTNIEKGWTGTNNSSCTWTTIVDAYLNNYVNDDTTNSLSIYMRDGKAYIYLDYGALRYSDSGTLILAHYTGSNAISMIIYYDCDDPIHAGTVTTCCGLSACHSETLTVYLDPVVLHSSTPVADSTILMTAGSTYDVSFTCEGLNISDKSLIGFSFYDEDSETWLNANANTYGMIDYNDYIDLSYITGLGDRYTYVNYGTFRMTAVDASTITSKIGSYPTDAISCMVTIADYYKVVMKYASTNSTYINASSYQFDTYIANVEGEELFISSPDSSTQTTVVFNEQQKVTYYSAASMADITTTTSTACVKTVANTFGTETTVTGDNGGSISYTITAVTNSTTGKVSYYKLSYNGNTYIYQSGKYWKKQ